jgi:hypothetical protein
MIDKCPFCATQLAYDPYNRWHKMKCERGLDHGFYWSADSDIASLYICLVPLYPSVELIWCINTQKLTAAISLPDSTDYDIEYKDLKITSMEEFLEMANAVKNSIIFI